MKIVCKFIMAEEETKEIKGEATSKTQDLEQDVSFWRAVFFASHLIDSDKKKLKWDTLNKDESFEVINKLITTLHETHMKQEQEMVDEMNVISLKLAEKDNSFDLAG